MEVMANSSAAHKAELQKGLRSNEVKWTAPLMAVGWTALPSIILDKQPALGISALDLNILLQLAKYWWKRDDLPYPSKETLAELIGVTPSTIRRRIKRMEEEGLIQRIVRHDTRGGQQSNFYSFDGLIAKMQPHAKEALELRKKQNTEKETLRRKKKAQPMRQTLELVPRGRKK
jgi:predicted transcriptional regulator